MRERDLEPLDTPERRAGAEGRGCARPPPPSPTRTWPRPTATNCSSASTRCSRAARASGGQFRQDRRPAAGPAGRGGGRGQWRRSRSRCPPSAEAQGGAQAPRRLAASGRRRRGQGALDRPEPRWIDASGGPGGRTASAIRRSTIWPRKSSACDWRPTTLTPRPSHAIWRTGDLARCSAKSTRPPRNRARPSLTRTFARRRQSPVVARLRGADSLGGAGVRPHIRAKRRLADAGGMAAFDAPESGAGRAAAGDQDRNDLGRTTGLNDTTRPALTFEMPVRRCARAGSGDFDEHHHG